jgi:hypothetical protein
VPKSKEVLSKQNDGGIVEISNGCPNESKESLFILNLLHRTRESVTSTCFAAEEWKALGMSCLEAVAVGKL